MLKAEFVLGLIFVLEISPSLCRFRKSCTSWLARIKPSIAPGVATIWPRGKNGFTVLILVLPLLMIRFMDSHGRRLSPPPNRSWLSSLSTREKKLEGDVRRTTPRGSAHGWQQRNYWSLIRRWSAQVCRDRLSQVALVVFGMVRGAGPYLGDKPAFYQ